ncbi:MAG: outer membrane beta-barrel protein [Vicinamibacterales bacterium]
MKLSVCAGACVLAIVLGSPRAEARQVEAGIKGGVTVATLSTEGLQGLESNSGVGGLGGAWISFGGERGGLRTEVLVAGRRSSLVSAGPAIDVSSTSVDVPVLVYGRWGSGRRVRPMLFGGVELGAITSVSQTVDGTKTDIGDEIRAFDAGVVVGVGLEVGQGRHPVVFDVRYVAGLRDLSESSETTFKRRTVEFSVGVRF